MTPHVVVVGDLVTDVVAVLTSPLAPDSDTPARIHITGGGQAANTAAWLAWAARRRSGHTNRPTASGTGPAVTLVAAAGTDLAGDARIRELRAAGVRCAVTRRPNASTGTIVVLAHGGQRTMLTDRGANLTLTDTEVDAALYAIPHASHLHLSAYPLLDEASRGAGLRALAAARERGLSTSVDAASVAPLRRAGASAFATWVRGTDLLLANADEATELSTGAPWSTLTALTRVGVVVKQGPAGALWLGADGRTVSAPAVATQAVDTTGAGDAFAAGLLAAWTAGAAADAALRAGARLGALAVAQPGARPPVEPPSRSTG